MHCTLPAFCGVRYWERDGKTCHCSADALSKVCFKYLDFFRWSTKYLHSPYSSPIQLASLQTAWLNSALVQLQRLQLQPPYNQAKIVLLFPIFFFLTSHSSIVLAFNTCSKPAIAAWSAFVVHLQGMTFLFSWHKSTDGNVIFHSWVVFNIQAKAEWKKLSTAIKAALCKQLLVLIGINIRNKHWKKVNSLQSLSCRCNFFLQIELWSY